MYLNTDYLIEKLGFASINSQGNSVNSFEGEKDEKVKKELKLIQNVKLYHDPFAEEQLITMYRGLITNIVNTSPVTKRVGFDMAYQHAVAALKSCIANYDLNSYKRNKPSTYITTTVKQQLNKLDTSSVSQQFVNMSENLNTNNKSIQNAKSVLTPQLGRTPTNEEILNFVKNDLGYGKNLDLDKIQRIQHYTTSELSGSKTIDTDTGAEAVSFEEVEGPKETADDLLNKESTERKIISTIQEFTQNKNERRFLMQYFAIGEFKGADRKQKGYINNIARANGLSYYNMNKLINSFRDFCMRKGVI